MPARYLTCRAKLLPSLHSTEARNPPSFALVELQCKQRLRAPDQGCWWSLEDKTILYPSLNHQAPPRLQHNARLGNGISQQENPCSPPGKNQPDKHVGLIAGPHVPWNQIARSGQRTQVATRPLFSKTPATNVEGADLKRIQPRFVKDFMLISAPYWDGIKKTKCTTIRSSYLCVTFRNTDKNGPVQKIFCEIERRTKSDRDCQTHFIKYSNINRLEHKEQIDAKRQPTFSPDHRAGNDEFAGAGEPGVGPSISTGAVHSGG
jgi:hypothetical protein